MPIRDILNANPAWVRANLDVEVGSDLLYSINRYGMKIPVLLRSDGLLIDGARRVAAAANLGWDTVPVVVSDDWDRILVHLRLTVRDTAELGLPSTPYTWLEFEDHYRRIAREAYTHKLNTMRAGNRGYGKTRTKGFSEIGRIMSPLYGITYSTLKRVMSCTKIMREMADEDPAKYKQAMAAFLRVEETTHAPSEAHRLIMKIRDGEGRRPVADMREAARQSAVLSGGIPALLRVSSELAGLGFINEAIDLPATREHLGQMKKVMANLNRVRRELEHRINTSERESTDDDDDIAGSE